MLGKNTDIIFEELSREIDITPSLFEKAEKRYKAVAEWINRENSHLNELGVDAEIYLQGSAKLGTVTKPMEENDDYDIDAVCVLKNISKNQVTQEQVKEAFGRDIKDYAKAKSMNKRPKNGKRCWTLYYYDEANFHMDFLPAIPDGNEFGIALESHKYFEVAHVENTIAITDKNSPFYNIISNNWYVSNPIGYFEWFKEQMKERYEFQKQAAAESMNISIEEVPEYRVKTSLQKAIQILKRHRNIFFKDEEEFSVASVIITTLAAKAYTGNPSLSETLREVTTSMEKYVGLGVKGYEIANPVNPLENFADKWNNDTNYVIAFKGWIKEVKEDIENILEGNENIFKDESLLEGYKSKFGEKSINIAYGKGLMEFEKKNGKKAEVIAASTVIPKIVKPYGGDSL